jgi:CBS domain-containing protein
VKAADLATPYPTVRLDTPVPTAVELLSEQNRPGLVVVDEHEHPVAIMPASRLLRFVVPGYLQDDPALARVLDDDFAETAYAELDAKTVAELLPKDRPRLLIARPDDNPLEIACLMVADDAPLVAVVDGPGKQARMIGAITVAQVLTVMAPNRT